MGLKIRLSLARNMADVKKRSSQRSVYAALSFSNILRLNLYFPGWVWVGGGGWGKSRLKTISVQLRLKLGLSLAIILKVRAKMD